MMLSIPAIGVMSIAFFGFHYLLPFIVMIECGPTVTTILTIISVPEYRKKLKICFKKVVRS